MDDAVENFALRRVLKHNGTELGPIKPATGVEDARTEGPNNLLQARCPGLHHLPRNDICVHQDRTQFLQPGSHQ
ncbi:hypothetical protein D3C73_1491960 [compost metagenome]